MVRQTPACFAVPCWVCHADDDRAPQRRVSETKQLKKSGGMGAGVEGCDFYGVGTLVLPQLGDVLSIFWPLDRAWYEGTVECTPPSTRPAGRD